MGCGPFTVSVTPPACTRPRFIGPSLETAFEVAMTALLPQACLAGTKQPCIKKWWEGRERVRGAKYGTAPTITQRSWAYLLDIHTYFYTVVKQGHRKSVRTKAPESLPDTEIYLQVSPLELWSPYLAVLSKERPIHHKTNERPSVSSSFDRLGRLTKKK